MSVELAGRRISRLEIRMGVRDASGAIADPIFASYTSGPYSQREDREAFLTTPARVIVPMLG